jgi:hypothetical protein
MRVCAGPRWALPRAVNTLSAVANLGRESSSPWAPTRASCHVPGVNDLRSATCRLPLASDASEPARCDPPWRPADSNAGHRRRALDCDNCPAIAELGRSAGRCEREPCNATARLRADWILSYGARICCVPVGLPSSINPASRRTFAGAVSALVRARLATHPLSLAGRAACALFEATAASDVGVPALGNDAGRRFDRRRLRSGGCAGRCSFALPLGHGPRATGYCRCATWPDGAGTGG